MPSLNRVFLAGNLTRDPEVRRLPSGSAVAKLGLAVSRKYKARTGQEVDETCFVDLETWERQAEFCEKYLHKGDPVLVEGSLRYEKWESKTGEKRSRLLVRADRIESLRAKNDGPPTDTRDPDADFTRPEPGAGASATAAGPDLAPKNSDPDDIPF